LTDNFEQLAEKTLDSCNNLISQAFLKAVA